ncbi:MAG: rod-binding protein [Syntrophales bacterium]|nr:rod-binding protein [Syntrophales bacterium]
MKPFGKIDGVSNQGIAFENQQSNNEKRLKRACADFEALLIYQMLKTMRRTVPRGGVFSQGVITDTWYMVMDQSIAESIAQRNGGLGIQNILYDHLVSNTGKKDRLRK